MNIDLKLIGDALGVGFYFGTVVVGFIAALMWFAVIIRLVWAAMDLVKRLANRPKPVEEPPQQMELNKNSPYYERWMKEAELMRNVNADKYVPKTSPNAKTNDPS